MSESLLRATCLLLAVVMVFGATACYGQFVMTSTVYEMNGKPENPVMDSLLFWLFAFAFPLYHLAVILDVLVFNVIEFWSGQNPMALGPGPDGPVHVRTAPAD